MNVLIYVFKHEIWGRFLKSKCICLPIISECIGNYIGPIKTRQHFTTFFLYRVTFSTFFDVIKKGTLSISFHRLGYRRHIEILNNPPPGDRSLGRVGCPGLRRLDGVTKKKAQHSGQSPPFRSESLQPSRLGGAMVEAPLYLKMMHSESLQPSRLGGAMVEAPLYLKMMHSESLQPSRLGGVMVEAPLNQFFLEFTWKFSRFFPICAKTIRFFTFFDSPIPCTPPYDTLSAPTNILIKHLFETRKFKNAFLKIYGVLKFGGSTQNFALFRSTMVPNFLKIYIAVYQDFVTICPDFSRTANANKRPQMVIASRVL